MAFDIASKLEIVGKIVVAGFGDQALPGAIAYLCREVTPSKVYKFIKEGGSLIAWGEDKDWAAIRKLVQGAKVDKLSHPALLKIFSNTRPDLMGVVINQPGGEEWLDKQISELRTKLGLDKAASVE